MTFATRKLSVVFTLGTGDFGQGEKKNTMTLKNMRIRADIVASGLVTDSTATLTIYGVPLDIMAKLTVLNVLALTDQREGNTVSVFAGDDDKTMTLVFRGMITQAWADMKSPSEAKFVVQGQTGILNAIKPVPPNSFRGSVDVETILGRIASQWTPTLTLENNGVNVQLNNPYKAGTLADQLRSVARDGNFNFIVTSDNILAIWPKDGARKGTAIIMSPETGMVGYPSFTQTGIQVTSLFNPLITFGIPVKVKSILTQAAGTWRIDHVAHNLESEMPNGAWFTEIECSQFNKPVPLK